MFLVLFLLFVLVPLAELFVIIEVGQRIGGPETILLLVFVSLAGAWLVKRQGLGVWYRLNRQMETGRLPTNEIIDGALILGAGALLLFPGFITDAVGLLLLLPPTRFAVRTVLLGRLTRRIGVVGTVGRRIRVVTATESTGPGRPPWSTGGDRAPYPPELGP